MHLSMVLVFEIGPRLSCSAMYVIVEGHHRIGDLSCFIELGLPLVKSCSITIAIAILNHPILTHVSERCPKSLQSYLGIIRFHSFPYLIHPRVPRVDLIASLFWKPEVLEEKQKKVRWVSNSCIYSGPILAEFDSILPEHLLHCWGR